MSFLAPLFLYIGLGVAAAAVALHFIVTRQPHSSSLPTARFAPEGSVRVVTIARPTDLATLALRVLLAILIGAAFARPVIVPERRPVARIVLADVSRAVASIETVRDSARALLGRGDLLVVFDSTARVVRQGAADSAVALERSSREGRLSPALIAALRAAATIRETADSVELALVSPLRSGEADGATRRIRALWQGRIRLVRVPAAADSASGSGFAVRAAAEDPVRVAAALMGRTGDDAPVRIVRDAATAADSAWAAGGRRTLVRWPETGAPPGWIPRSEVDTAGAVVAGQAALVLPLERRWRLSPSARPARVVVRWVDGRPAGVEYAAGNGCIRDVAVPVPERGDVVLRPTFARLLEEIAAPCASSSSSPALSDDELAMLEGLGPLAAAAAIRPPDTIATPLVPWLLGLAILLAFAELYLRRDRSR